MGVVDEASTESAADDHLDAWVTCIVHGIQLHVVALYVETCCDVVSILIYRSWEVVAPWVDVWGYPPRTRAKMAVIAGSRMTARACAGTDSITTVSVEGLLCGTSSVTTAGQILLAACAFPAKRKEYLDHVLLVFGSDILEQGRCPEFVLGVLFGYRRQAVGVVTSNRLIASGIVSECVAGFFVDSVDQSGLVAICE